MIPRRTLHEAQDPSTHPQRLIEIAEDKALMVRRRLAQNPSLPAKLATQIFYPFDEVVWRSLAKNPSVPGNLLFQLSIRFPEEIIENPSLPLSLLEDPGLLQRSSLRYYLLTAQNATLEVLSSAASDEVSAYRRLAARHTKTPPALVARLAFDPDAEVRRAAIQNKNIPQEIFSKIERYKHEPLDEAEWAQAFDNAYLRLLLAQNLTLSDERVVQLFAAGPSRVKQEILRREALPKQILETPLQELSPYVMELLLRHPQASIEVLKEFLDRAYELERGVPGALYKHSPELSALSENPQLTPAMLQILIERGYITKKLASHPALTEAQLQTILLHYNREPSWNQHVRTTAANHPNAPKLLLALLQRAGFDARTGMYDEKNISLTEEEEDKLATLGMFARGLVIRNPRVKKSLLIEILASKDFLYLFGFANDNRNIDVESVLASKDTYPTRTLLLRHPSATPTFIYRLWSSYSEAPLLMPVQPKSEADVFDCIAGAYVARERVIAARNVHLPAHLRVRLSRDYSAEVRSTIAERSDLTRETLTRLLQDISPEVRRAAARNPSSPQRFLSLLRRSGASEDLTEFAPPDLTISEQELSRLSRKGHFAKLLAVRHPRTPSEALKRLALSQHEVASYAVCHPNTSEETLLQVAKTKNRPLHLALLKRTYPLSEEILFALLGSDSREVRRLAAQRREAKDVCDLFYRAGASPEWDDFVTPDTSMRSELLEPFARGSFYAQQLAARHPQTSPEILREFLVCMKPMLRSLSAQNPSSPKNMIATLQKIGASEDLSEIEAPDEDASEADFEEAQQSGPFGELLAALMQKVPG